MMTGAEPRRRGPRAGRGQALASSLAILVLCSLCLLPVSCGEGGATAYVVRQGAVVIGGQSVKVETGVGSTTYAATEHRPFARFDTTVTRTLTVSPDLRQLRRYSSERRVPGAVYRTYLERYGGYFHYLENELQTFSYTPKLTADESFLPYETDSACLVQALVSRFRAANVSEAVAFVVVPSRGALVRSVFVKTLGEGRFEITGEELARVEATVDGRGVLETAKVEGGLSILRGGAGPLNSKPYSPAPGAYEVREVRVPTAQRAASGESIELAGSLYLPRGKGPYPAVVIEADYGPQDRTGCGLSSQVATSLVARGFAVLSCDRRGIPDSEGDFSRYTVDTLAGDLEMKVQYMFLRGDIDPEHIFLVGHGQGGLVASMVAAQNPYVAACVLLATPSERMFPELERTVIRRAGERGLLLPEEVDSKERNLDNLVTVLETSEGDTVDILDHTLFLGWMKSAEGLYPPGAVAGVPVPVLVVQGGEDAIVPPSQASVLMAGLEARPSGVQELAMFDGLGHDLGRWVDEADARPYRAHVVVDLKVLDKVTSWLKALE